MPAPLRLTKAAGARLTATPSASRSRGPPYRKAACNVPPSPPSGHESSQIQHPVEAVSDIQTNGTLRESGIEMTIATFRSALYRARKKRDQGQTGQQRGSRERSSGGGSSGDSSQSDGEQRLKGASKAAPGARSSADARQETRDPLAVPKRPKSFDWDPTARPEVTFINKDDDKADTEP